MENPPFVRDARVARLLTGMSVTDVEARDQLSALATARGASVAFMQMGEPSLTGELTRLADHGYERLVVVGVSLGGPMAPAHSWLRRIAAYWWRERAGHRPGVEVATRLMNAAMSETFDDVARDLKAIHGSEPGLTSTAWENVPDYRHQVMVCRGPRCTAQGAEESLRGLILAMMEHHVTDDDVLLVHTGCQFPCNQAPVLCVQPDDVWYGHVDADAAREIVAEHLVGGRPVDRGRLPRDST